MTNENNFGSLLTKLLDGWDGGIDSSFISNRAISIQRYIKVNSNKNPFPLKDKSSIVLTTDIINLPSGNKFLLIFINSALQMTCHSL